MNNLPPGQIAFTILLVLSLLGLAGFFAWGQWQALAALKTASDMSPADRTYTHRQIWRRLICSVLMVVMAGLLGASLALEGPAQELVDLGQRNRERNEPRQLNPEEQRFFNFYRTFWIVTLLVLLAIIVVAAMDFFAIRRYGLRQFRQIQADRRAMIEGELTRLRSQRNGHT